MQREKSALVKHEASASASNSNENGGTFDGELLRCLNAAVRQWDSVVAQPQASHSYPYLGRQPSQPSTSKISRIVQLVDLCLSTGKLKSCGILLVLVVKSQADLSTKFKTLFTPLIPELRQLLTRKAIDISSSPFGDFFRVVIGAYLQHILGAKPRHNRAPKIRKIGCGCGDCRAINNFLLSAASQQTFRAPQSRRTHIEGHLRVASDLLTYTTIRSGSPHGLHVTKNQEIVAAAQWLIRQGEAKTFLGRIGNDAVIGKIMGDRYADVINALDGSQQYRLAAGNDARRPSTSGSGIPAVSNLAPTSIPSPSAPPMALPPVVSGTSLVAGQKRKKTPEVDGDVVDLTGDSP